MANPDHLRRLKEDTTANWNAWRAGEATLKPDLRGAHLKGHSLSGANLSDADLSDAMLRHANLAGADLTRAHVVGANLTFANLRHAVLIGADLLRARLAGADLRSANLTNAFLAQTDLSGADLRHACLLDAELMGATLIDAHLVGADLSGALLAHTDLTRADLSDANLANAALKDTILADIDLISAKGLGQCRHFGPSSIDVRTLMRSPNLPVLFLRGCGLPDTLIDNLPSLTSQTTGFFSVFISYSTANQDFAERLHADLQSKGVRCWFAPHDIRPGEKIHEQIAAAIHVHDKLLLVLSRESMRSAWVKTEIARARKKEREQHRAVLCPIRLVPFDDVRTWEHFDADLGTDSAKEIREYYLPDFSRWKTDHDEYARELNKLIDALRGRSTVEPRPTFDLHQ